jgi:hypothetical protein
MKSLPRVRASAQAQAALLTLFRRGILMGIHFSLAPSTCVRSCARPRTHWHIRAVRLAVAAALKSLQALAHQARANRKEVSP